MFGHKQKLPTMLNPSLYFIFSQNTTPNQGCHNGRPRVTGRANRAGVTDWTNGQTRHLSIREIVIYPRVNFLEQNDTSIRDEASTVDKKSIVDAT